MEETFPLHDSPCRNSDFRLLDDAAMAKDKVIFGQEKTTSKKKRKGKKEGCRKVLCLGFSRTKKEVYANLSFISCEGPPSSKAIQESLYSLQYKQNGRL
jgi:hypothetical protein